MAESDKFYLVPVEIARGGFFFRTSRLRSFPIVEGDAADGDCSKFFRGDGPPPENLPGAQTGDGYLDVVTGDFYVLEA